MSKLTFLKYSAERNHVRRLKIMTVGYSEGVGDAPNVEPPHRRNVWRHLRVAERVILIFGGGLLVGFVAYPIDIYREFVVLVFFEEKIIELAGWFTRVILFGLGALFWGYLISPENAKMRAFQLGMVGPAFISAFLVANQSGPRVSEANNQTSPASVAQEKIVHKIGYSIDVGKLDGFQFDVVKKAENRVNNNIGNAYKELEKEKSDIVELEDSLILLYAYKNALIRDHVKDGGRYSDLEEKSAYLSVSSEISAITKLLSEKEKRVNRLESIAEGASSRSKTFLPSKSEPSPPIYCDRQDEVSSVTWRFLKGFLGLKGNCK